MYEGMRKAVKSEGGGYPTGQITERDRGRRECYGGDRRGAIVKV